MDIFDSSINLATIALIGMGVAVVLSLITLMIYFFGGPSPMERHLLGRIEANSSPGDVLRAQRQYRTQRLAWILLFVLIIWAVLYQAAPMQMEQAGAAFFEAVSITARAARDATGALVQELRSGNE